MMATARRAVTLTRSAAKVGWLLLPADIDFNLHLNNARYMMLADLAHDPENRNRFSERIMRQIKCYCVLGASDRTLARSVQPRPPTEAERVCMTSTKDCAACPRQFEASMTTSPHAAF
ncbi:hypothetical protein [Mesorhizobium sp. LSJC264A00]|uniref:hypothetical protein n=1 Tax=unclassified Mesorhizobium TaxID=325217 RepID=UPI0003CE065C|nr:hypothetical protein [Mesorhizobium sp. LSJC264A00]ESX28810.1 hypothetical protein X767_00715 [Mesorhizobium sp. LSJC264A00]